MAKNNPYDDLEAHQKLMEKLATASENAELLNNDVSEALDELKDHNNDLNAHPLIQNQIKELSAMSVETVDGRITDHNSSALAHADIRAAIEEAKADTVAAKAVVSEAISEHNSASNTHPDIREQISALNTKIGGINVSDLQTRINEIQSELDNKIAEEITDLQSVDAKHDSLIHENANNISSLEDRLGIVNKHTTTVASYVISQQTELDRLALQAFCLDKEEVLGYTRNVSGTSIENLVASLPTYVAGGSTVDFTITGATGTDISYTVIPGVSSISITTDSNPITDTSTLTLAVNDTVSPGDILWFTCTITDNTGSSNNVLNRVFAVMVAKPMSSSLISLEGLPAGVEPSRDYTVTISNLADGGDGRYTYELDPLTSGITFSKSTGLHESESVTLTAPAEGDPSIRGTDLTFNLVVHDQYGADSIIEFVLPVNELPSTDNFYTNLPTILVPGKTYTVKFNGIQSAQGNDARYAIQEANGLVTFSKASNILANENIKMTVSGSATRGAPVSFVITASDENEVNTSINLVRSINYRPTLTGLSVAFNTVVKGGASYNLALIGGVDPERASDGDLAVTYKIDTNLTPFTFSKVENIVSGENVVVSIPKVATTTTYSFFVYTVDEAGETSEEAKPVTVTVNPIWVADAPVILSPAEDEVVDVDGFTMRWSGFTYYADVQE